MSVAVRRAIYGKLAGDATLNNLLGSPPSGQNKSLYHNTAPSGAEFPFVIFFKSSNTPLYSMGRRVFEDEVWTIKAVDRSADSDGADQIAARLDALLTDGTISISGSGQRYLRRISDTEYEEHIDGVRYCHAGALFRLVHEPA